MTLTIRPATPADAPAMCDLLNAVIALGGTTAHEVPFDAARMTADYISHPDAIAATVALDDAGLAGFQVLGWMDRPRCWAEVGTFVRIGGQGSGVGRALFATTRAAALAAGARFIDATIRADNFGGLRYYGGLGFRDYAIQRHRPLRSGRCVDRHRKVYTL